MYQHTYLHIVIRKLQTNIHKIHKKPNTNSCNGLCYPYPFPFIIKCHTNDRWAQC